MVMLSLIKTERVLVVAVPALEVLVTTVLTMHLLGEV